MELIKSFDKYKEIGLESRSQPSATKSSKLNHRKV